jgi:hypothetical protein
MPQVKSGFIGKDVRIQILIPPSGGREPVLMDLEGCDVTINQIVRHSTTDMELNNPPASTTFRGSFTFNTRSTEPLKELKGSARMMANNSFVKDVDDIHEECGRVRLIRFKRWK